MLNEENLYARIVTGELSQEEITKLKDSGDWDAIQEILEASNQLRMPPLDNAKNIEKIYSESEKSKKRFKRRKLLFRSLSAAAALIIIIGGSLILLNPRTLLETQNGQTLDYVFSDQSEVLINAKSKLRFNKNTWDRRRSLTLDGEAYFKVQKGAPFTVKSKLGSVRVLGTEFNVKTHDDAFEVECFEGKVQVVYGDSKLVLEKNDAAYFDSKGKLSQVDIPNSEADWLNGRSRFRNQRLAKVLREFERQFDVVVSSNTNEISFTGVFEHADLEIAANQIAKPLGLTYEISSDKKSITFSQ